MMTIQISNFLIEMSIKFLGLVIFSRKGKERVSHGPSKDIGDDKTSKDIGDDEYTDIKFSH